MIPGLYFLAQSDWLAFVLVGTPFVVLAVWQLSKVIRKPGLASAPRDVGGEVTDYFGLFGLMGYMTAIVLPDGVAKLSVWAASSIALLAVGSDLFGPVNPMWLLVVLAFGYGVYRIEWRTLLEIAKEGEHGSGGNETGPSTGAESPDDASPPILVRFATFAIVNLLLVAAVWQISRTVNAQDDAMPAPTMALVYIAIAVAGAGIALLMSRLFCGWRVARIYAGATFVVGLVAASVMHIPATPAVGSWVWGETEWAQYWKPTLIAFACVGATATVLTTLAGRLTQIRPLMVALVLPAAYLLPSEFLFDGDRGASMLDWLARFLEAAITMMGVWLMWYGFGPGRRNTAERLNVFPSVAA